MLAVADRAEPEAGDGQEPVPPTCTKAALAERNARSAEATAALPAGVSFAD